MAEQIPPTNHDRLDLPPPQQKMSAPVKKVYISYFESLNNDEFDEKK